jgi:aspartokinase
LIVMKFGGTSVADAERIRAVAAIVRERLDRRPVVVLSAMGGVTDLLERAVQVARGGERDGLEPLLAELERGHRWALAGVIEDAGSLHDLRLERARQRGNACASERIVNAAHAHCLHLNAGGQIAHQRAARTQHTQHFLAARHQRTHQAPVEPLRAALFAASYDMHAAHQLNRLNPPFPEDARYRNQVIFWIFRCNPSQLHALRG